MQSHIPTWQPSGGSAWQLPPFKMGSKLPNPCPSDPTCFTHLPHLAFGFVASCSASIALTPPQSVSSVRSAHPERGPGTEHRDGGGG